MKQSIARDTGLGILNSIKLIEFLSLRGVLEHPEHPPWIRHCEVKPSAVLALETHPSAIFPVVHERNRCFNWFIVVALRLEMRFLADQPLRFPVSTERSTYNLYKLALRSTVKSKASLHLSLRIQRSKCSTVEIVAISRQTSCVTVYAANVHDGGNL